MTTTAAKTLRRKKRKQCNRIERELARSDALVMRTIHRAAKSGQVVVATETPVDRFDESRGYVIREVLLMSGCEFRGGRKQVPIVDSHDDKTVRNIFGSVQSMQADGQAGELYGTPKFASDPDAQTIAKRFDEGHITDFSITALPIESVFVPPGETYTTNRNETIEGPAQIITRWEPHNASICATGADVNSTVRRSYTNLTRKVERMEGMSETLAGLGVPEDIAGDQNAVIAFLAGKLSKENAVEPVVENMEEEPSVVENMDQNEESIRMEEEDMSERKEESLEEVARSAAKQERARSREIYAACETAKLERKFADSLVNSDASLADARAKIIERMAANAGALGTDPTDVKVTESSDDKFYAAARDGLMKRAASAASLEGLSKSLDESKPASGAADFQNMRLSRMAEEFAVKAHGDAVRRMPAKDIALIAMEHPGTLRRHHLVMRDAYHTTGSFPNLLLDASNKTLLSGYEEAPYTWTAWARTATPVEDFKNINRIRYSEMGNPEMVPENHDYPEAKTGDQKETYKVEKYGSVFTVTWETVVNDDLDAISRTPAMQGASCRRKQNAVVYSVLTDNANMADGGALFNTTAQTTSGGHANLAGSGAAISTSTLNDAFTSMMTKKGIGTDGTDSSAILNIQPQHLIVPVAISATAMQIVGSIADPSQGGDTTGNSNVHNIYGPNGQRPLNVIVEPVLDGNSATAWYLAANNGQVDTVEVTFLAGEQSPVLESEWDFDKDVYKYKVRQSFAAAAIDYRGLYKNAGS